MEVNDLHLRDALDVVYNFPKTLRDIGISKDNREVTNRALLAVWTEIGGNLEKPLFSASAHISVTPTRPQASDKIDRRLFEDPELNLKWVLIANRTSLQLIEELSKLDALEPDQKTRAQAMKHTQFREFWLQAEKDEWDGLWKRGCFKKWKHSNLRPNDRVLGSS